MIKYYESIETGESKNENLEKYYKNRLANIINQSELKAENVKAYIPKLLCDLNKLIGALEIYIWDYVGNKELKYYNPDIEKVHPSTRTTHPFYLKLWNEISMSVFGFSISNPFVTNIVC